MRLPLAEQITGEVEATVLQVPRFRSRDPGGEKRDLIGTASGRTHDGKHRSGKETEKTRKSVV